MDTEVQEVIDEQLPTDDQQNNEEQESENVIETDQAEEQTESLQEESKEEVKPEEAEKPKVSRAQKRITDLNDKLKAEQQAREALERKLKLYEDMAKPVDANEFDDDAVYQQKANISNQAAFQKEVASKELDEHKKAEDALKQQAYQIAQQEYNEKMTALDAEQLSFVQEEAFKFKVRPTDIITDVYTSEYSNELTVEILKDVDRYNNMTDAQFTRAVARLEGIIEGRTQGQEAKITRKAKPADPPSDLKTASSSISTSKPHETPNYADWRSRL